MAAPRERKHKIETKPRPKLSSHCFCYRLPRQADSKCVRAPHLVADLFCKLFPPFPPETLWIPELAVDVGLSSTMSEPSRRAWTFTPIVALKPAARPGMPALIVSTTHGGSGLCCPGCV
jgi:hypothetical protein